MARLLEGRYADCERIILVCDNLNTHTKGAFTKSRARPGQGVGPADRVLLHAQARQLAKHSRKRTEFPDTSVRDRSPLGRCSNAASRNRAWSSDVNSTQRGVDWQMKIDDARCKLKSVYPKIKL